MWYTRRAVSSKVKRKILTRFVIVIVVMQDGHEIAFMLCFFLRVFGRNIRWFWLIAECRVHPTPNAPTLPDR